MKSVLISIRPKWCDLIASGKKTIEVRKTRPKMVTPYKCYIYCTKDRHNAFVVRNGQAKKINCDNSDTAIYCGGYPGNGKVIGEFVCDRILEIDCDSVAPYDYETTEYIDGEICFGRDELIKYAGYVRPFGWHISDLVIYDKPKDLSELEKPCMPGKCPYHEECGGVEGGCIFAHHTRPPAILVLCGGCKMNYEEKIIWHEIVTRPLTQEEQEECSRLGEEYTYMFNCEMPEDGEEILIATEWGVSADICGIDDGFYLENRGDWDDVIAWAEMPKYRKENGK